MRFRHSTMAGGDQERVHAKYWVPLENMLSNSFTEFLRHYSMNYGHDLKQGGVYIATENRLKELESAQAVEDEMQLMLRFGCYYRKFLSPTDEIDSKIRNKLINIREIKVTTCYPLLLRMFESRNIQELSNSELGRCLWVIERFIIRRPVCAVPANQLGKLFLQLAKIYPSSDHTNWLIDSLPSFSGNRRFPSNAEFKEAFTTQPQYGRGASKFILDRLELSFNHKETVDLSLLTIEHVLPQTLSDEWKNSLGQDAEALHLRLLHTFGNLTLTGYKSRNVRWNYSAWRKAFGHRLRILAKRFANA